MQAKLKIYFRDTKMKTLKDILADNIKTRRIALGYNVEQLSEKIGVSKSTISQWESGAININPKRMPAIAAALNTTEQWLVNEHENSSNTISIGKQRDGNRQTIGTSIESVESINDCLAKLLRAEQERDQWRDKYIKLLETTAGI